MPHRSTGRLVLLVIAAIALSLVVCVVPLNAHARPLHLKGDFVVGHFTAIVHVPGSRFGEDRPVQVNLWYPAHHVNDCDVEISEDREGSSEGRSETPSVYMSRLRGVPLLPQWDPLAWALVSRLSFDNLPSAGVRCRFPVIVFSHGHQNNAIDYVYTLEALARSGFIVAAPDHLNGTQDDVRIDFINAQARRTVIPCFDGRPSPCAHSDVPDVSNNMIDRMHDITAVLDALPTWFGNRVDLSRVGVLGHSRGTVSALAAAGGSTTWGFDRIRDDDGNARVRAVMGLAIGVHDITFGASLQNVTVPTLLVAGALDATEPVSLDAFSSLGARDKAIVIIGNADHRHFDAGLCAQLQSAGNIAATNPRAILDLQTTSSLVIAPLHRRAMDFCGVESFTNPDNPSDESLRGLVTSLTGFKVTPDDVPATGVDSTQVKDEVVELAVEFFRRALQ
jgi:predicted dienelactone hydrolase